MRRLPPLNSIKAFEAVVRLGSYNLAAAELRVTHGAISRQVRILEGYFGCRLFQARGRNLVPTALAKYYAGEVGAGLNSLALATRRVAEPASAKLVRVSGHPSFTMHWLMPRLADFREANASTEVSIAASREPLDHLVSTADIIIRRRPMEWDGFECRPILEDCRVLVCSPAYLAENPIRTPSDVMRATILVGNGRTQVGVWERWFKDTGMTPPRNVKRIKFDLVFLLVEAVQDGLGLAFLPYSLCAAALASGRLVEPIPGLRQPYSNMYALYPDASRRTTSVKAFVSWLMAEGETFSVGFRRSAALAGSA